MSKCLYDLYQEKVGVGLKDHKEICEYVVEQCKELIDKQEALPYWFTITNVDPDDLKLISPALSVRGIIAYVGIPYTDHAVPCVDIRVKKFIKADSEIPEPPKPPELRKIKRWWEWK